MSFLSSFTIIGRATSSWLTLDVWKRVLVKRWTISMRSHLLSPLICHSVQSCSWTIHSAALWSTWHLKYSTAPGMCSIRVDKGSKLALTGPFCCSRHGKEVDWWSFGILTHDMLTGNPPFTGNNRKVITERVLKAKLQLKKYLTPNAKDLLRQLLQRSVESRLGHGEEDAKAVKAHRFFKGVNWDDVMSRRTKPPFLPLLKSEDDFSHFDDEFTSKPAIDSPAGPLPSQSVDDVFLGFSYYGDAAWASFPIMDAVWASPAISKLPCKLWVHFEVVKSGELARALLLMLISVNYLLSGSSISIFILVLLIYVSLWNKPFISMTRYYLPWSCSEESKDIHCKSKGTNKILRFLVLYYYVKDLKLLLDVYPLPPTLSLRQGVEAPSQPT